MRVRATRRVVHHLLSDRLILAAIARTEMSRIRTSSPKITWMMIKIRRTLQIYNKSRRKIQRMKQKRLIREVMDRQELTFLKSKRL